MFKALLGFVLACFCAQICVSNANKNIEMAMSAYEIDQDLSPEEAHQVFAIFQDAARHFSNHSTTGVKLLKNKFNKDLDILAIKQIKGDADSYKMHKLATIAIEAGKNMMKKEEAVKLNYRRGKDLDSYDFDINEYFQAIKIPEPYCPKVGHICCNPFDKYRSLSGTCNNLEFPWWGAANSPLTYFLPPAYDNRIDSPRQTGVNGKRLPNAKYLTDKVLVGPTRLARNNQLFTYFGQFLDHDLSFTASVTDQYGTPKSCECGTDDKDCFNIDFPKNDPYYKNLTCISLVRSAAALPSFDCYLGARTQYNKVSHWLDLNQVYGNSLEENSKLRTFQNGLLKSSGIRGQPHLPFRGKGGCTMQTAEPCFNSGDDRAEQNSWLTATQTYFLRLHNSIAGQLKETNPHWDDNRLFQEAKRICTAIYQHIVFNDYLPLLLGDKTMKKFNLYPLENGYFNGYNSQLYPNIYTEFSTAAFRLHNTVYNNFTEALCENFELKDPDFMNEYILDTSKFYTEAEIIFCGLLISHGKSYGPDLPYDLNYDLFHKPGQSMGAINIQRGRDHGLQPYVKYRELCGFGKANDFDDLLEIPAQNRARLRKYYGNIGNIDLWVGLVNERVEEGSLVGPTASCMIARQFYILKASDSFYYENGLNPVRRFSSGQLKEIRKFSMSNLICEFGEVHYLQKYPFLMPDEHSNHFIDCKHVPKFNMKYWSKKHYDGYFVDKNYSNLRRKN